MDFKKYKPLIVVVLFAGLLGLFETRPQVIQFLDGQDPIVIFGLWYVVAGAFIYGLGKVLFHKHTKHHRVFAILLIYFAWNIVAYWPASDLTNQITKKQSSNILLASEDGMTFSFYQRLGVQNDLNTVLTYMVTPIVFFALAFFLMTPARFKQALQVVFT